MNNTIFSEILIKKFGENLYKKSIDFPRNKIKIISLDRTPLKLRSLILDNDREFHLLIDEKKLEIFHDCPAFLFNPNRDDKICNHIIKILTLIEEPIAKNLVNQLDNYHLTLEDYGSKKKSKNFLKLAYQCLEEENCVDGLNYLNKAIINAQESEFIIRKFLETAIQKNLFIEFFEFLQNSYENEFNDSLIKFNDIIEDGTTKFFKAISLYSFYEILRIINSIDSFLGRYVFQNASFISFLVSKLIQLAKSKNLNKTYFSFYFISKYYKNMINMKPEIENLLNSEEYTKFITNIVKYFLDEIENFCVIEKLKLMKKQFPVFGISENNYIHKYKAYKNEIKELERKVYLKKFSFLKFFIDKYNIKKTRVSFRKKRNTYIVTHDKENIENPAYKYIIKHLGFYGLNDSTIKSSEIGINYLIIKELFLDDLASFPDIFYYKKQFWGDSNEYEINPIDFHSIISKTIDDGYDVGKNLANSSDLILIEWDLANKPRQGSLVNAFGAQIVIPDQNNPLFHDLNPFDLCYCQKVPIKIERNLIKTINVITKTSFKDAIQSIANGMEFIDGYYPLSLIRSVVKKTINPFDANKILLQNEDKIFIPNYKKFIKEFQEFLFDFINKERELIYEEVKTNLKERTDQLLILLNLDSEIAGIELPREEMVNNLFQQPLSFYEFRGAFLEKVHSYISNLLNKKEVGSTIIFDLGKMRHTQFIKYSIEILDTRQDEFEYATIYKIASDNGLIYDITEIKRTYYGKKISEILNIGDKSMIRQETLNKFTKFALKLNLHLNITNN